MDDIKQNFRIKSGNNADCKLEGSSLTSWQAQFIFLTKGRIVKRYDVKRDKMDRLPNMNVNRCQHSSCTLGKTLYVLGGNG